MCAIYQSECFECDWECEHGRFGHVETAAMNHDEETGHIVSWVHPTKEHEI